MVITVTKSNQLKSIAILMMLCLHLFNREWRGLFEPVLFIGSQPVSYYISLFCDACVPIFAFVSGYGLYFKYKKEDVATYKRQNWRRLLKLYINFWIILILFAVLLGWILNKEGYPGSFTKFILNFTAIDPSYNGAWWFFTIYVLFVLTSGFWFRLLDKVNTYLLFSGLLLVYLMAFYFRIYSPSNSSNGLLRWLHTETALYFCTLFQFMLGAFTLKEGWDRKVSVLFSKWSYKSIVALALIVLLVVFHAFVPNFIVAPFTGFFFILFFIQIKLPEFLDKFLNFMTSHATNLWLVHMFFYMIYFPEVIYSPKNPILIFCWLVLLCVLSSLVIQRIEKPVLKWLKI